MGNKKLLVSLPLVALLVTGCVGKTHYDSKDYIISIKWENPNADYRILQLGDIHFSQSDNYEEHFKIIDKTFETANPDLIVINGDAFTFADKHVVKKLFSHIDSYNKPWTFTFGNHDDQGYYNDTYIAELLSGTTYTHSLFKYLKDDDVTGRSNFVIRLNKHTYDSSGKFVSSDPKYQVFMVESHSYNFDDMGYDYIKQDQIDWFNRVSDDTKVDDRYIPSSVYMHIATPEFYTAAEEAKTNPDMLLIGSTDEWKGGPSSKSDLHFFDAVKSHGGQSISCAHEHINDSVIYYQDMFLAFGVHSTDRIYKDDAKIGGQVTIINHLNYGLTFENIKVDKKTLETKIETAKEIK